MWKNSSTGYGLVSRSLHWGMALLLVGLFSLGWYMTELTYYDRWYKDSFSLHRALGMAALALALLRLAWLAFNPAPPVSPSLKVHERIAAKAVHRLLYLGMLAIPLSGYLMSTARGAGVDLFGLLELPAILPPAEGREEWAGRIHYLLAFGAAWIVLIHGLAALKHHFYDRDDTLLRMLGGQAPEGESMKPTKRR